MKFTYEGADLSKIIRKYEIKKNKIIVTYLDNKKKEYEFNEHIEKDLINTMLEQAKDRDEKYDDSNLHAKYYEGLINVSIIQGISMISLPFLTLIKNRNIGLTLCSCLVLFESKAAYELAKAGFKNAKLKDLVKYNCYLSIREELLKCKNYKELLNNNNINKDILNINNLDSVKLRKILNLYDNIEIKKGNKKGTFSTFI